MVWTVEQKRTMKKELVRLLLLLFVGFLGFSSFYWLFRFSGFLVFCFWLVFCRVLACVFTLHLRILVLALSRQSCW